MQPMIPMSSYNQTWMRVNAILQYPSSNLFSVQSARILSRVWSLYVFESTVFWCITFLSQASQSLFLKWSKFLCEVRVSVGQGCGEFIDQGWSDDSISGRRWTHSQSQERRWPCIPLEAGSSIEFALLCCYDITLYQPGREANHWLAFATQYLNGSMDLSESCISNFLVQWRSVLWNMASVVHLRCWTVEGTLHNPDAVLEKTNPASQSGWWVKAMPWR